MHRSARTPTFVCSRSPFLPRERAIEDASADLALDVHATYTRSRAGATGIRSQATFFIEASSSGTLISKLHDQRDQLREFESPAVFPIPGSFAVSRFGANSCELYPRHMIKSLASIFLFLLVAPVVLAKEKPRVSAEPEVRDALAKFVNAIDNLEWEAFRLA